LDASQEEHVDLFLYLLEFFRRGPSALPEGGEQGHVGFVGFQPEDGAAQVAFAFGDGGKTTEQWRHARIRAPQGETEEKKEAAQQCDEEPSQPEGESGLGWGGVFLL
jgi:hypothetical protein